MTCRTCQQGFTLLETVIASAVLGMFFLAIGGILQQILMNVGESRARTTALSLAQSKIETVRNLPFQNVGTAGGIPQGPLPQNEIVTINDLPYAVKTSIIYLDDPFDGVAPADLINNDYKRARIEVTWEGAYPSRKPVVAVTNIAPKGLETIAGGGTLMIRIFDANAQPVSNATVALDNDVVNPAIHTETLSDTNGYVIFPGAPACVACYRIRVTKSGFSTDRTYGIEEVTNPTSPHVTVIEGEVSSASFAIDQTGSVTIRSYGSRESGFPYIAAVFFTIRGAKIIGYNATDEPVYKYSYDTNTGGSLVTISGLEWDTYTLNFANSSHTLAGSNPINPFPLTPGESKIVDFTAIPKRINSLLLVVYDNLNTLVASASAHLRNPGLTYDETIDTGATGSPDWGQAFFPDFVPGQFELTASFSGYQEATNSLTLSGNTTETMTLNPIQ